MGPVTGWAVRYRPVLGSRRGMEVVVGRMWCAWLVAMVASSASAADIGWLGVHGTDVSPDDRARVARMLAEGVRQSGRHEALSVAELHGRMQGRNRLILREAVLADALELHEEGRLYFQQAEFEMAEAALDEALVMFREAVPFTHDVDGLWRVHMDTALVRLFRGDEVGARDALMAALALAPERVPDGADYPAELLALFEAERKVVVDEVGAVALRLSGDEEGELRVDGRALGASPLVAEGLLPGEHFFTGRTEEGQVASLRLSLEAGQEGAWHMTPTAPALGVPARAAGARSRQAARLARAVAAHATVDVLMLGQVEQGQLQLQLHAPGEDVFTQVVAVPWPATDAQLQAAGVALAAQISRRGQVHGHVGTTGCLPLDVSANPELASVLLQPVVPVTVAPLVAMPEDPLVRRQRTLKVAGIAGGAAVAILTGVVTGVLLANRPVEQAGGGSIAITGL